MARNTIVQKFRDTADEEKWKLMVADHDSLSSEEFKNKYGFAWSSIMNDAAARGYYERKRNYSPTLPSQKKVNGTDVFFVNAQPASIIKIARSVQLNDDIYKRLQALENDNGQYTHSSILNQLLDDALKKYGY